MIVGVTAVGMVTMIEELGIEAVPEASKACTTKECVVEALNPPAAPLAVPSPVADA